MNDTYEYCCDQFVRGVEQRRSTDSLQLTWETYDKPLCIKVNEPCNHHECLEAQSTKCCSGCSSAKTCTSRCMRSYRMITDDRDMIKRHIENGLPVLPHNCGQVLCDSEGYPQIMVIN